MQRNELFHGDELFFSGEDEPEEIVERQEPWRVLVVDDEPDVHSMTKMVLQDFLFEERSLEFLNAYSGEDSLAILKREEGIAIVLLDVVMENSSAGLEVAQKIRSELNDSFIRIILRTGQPGFAPEQTVITELDINDYWPKAELTSQRLKTSLTSALRSYRDLLKIEQNRTRLAKLAMSVAHQIRNRTMTINGFANIARRKIEPDSALGEYLDTISQEAGRLEMIVNSVSELAAIDQCDHGRIDVGSSCRKALELAEVFAGKIQRKICFVDSLQDYIVDGVPELFEKMVLVLLENAVVFSHRDEAEVKIVVYKSAGKCIVEVSDNGSGIAEADLPYIFDPFFTTRPDAVGMGLSIANRIAEGYNWGLDISNSDNGCLCRVEIVLQHGL